MIEILAMRRRANATLYALPEVPAFMAAWAVAVVLIDRWVVTALRPESPFSTDLGTGWAKATMPP